MAFLNKVGSCNMTGSVDIVANSLSLIRPDGSLQSLTLGGTVAPINSPQFTGTVGGVSKDTVGLGNVANTAPSDLPVSTATQNAINTVVSNTNSTFTTHLGLINTNKTNLSNLVISTNNTFASQLSLINNNKTSINGINDNIATIQSTLNTHTTNLGTLNTSVANINLTLTSQLGLINTNSANISGLVISTNNTFQSHLTQINLNKVSISGINDNIATIQSTLNTHTTNLGTLNTSVANINTTLTSHLGLINSNANNLSGLVISTNNTFQSHLTQINLNKASINGINDNLTTIQSTLNTHTTNLGTLNTSVANINITISSQLSTYATTAYVNNQVSNLVGAAPSYLDTLSELSSAIANDPNFSTTILNKIGDVSNTAKTTLTTTYSIINNVLPTLATTSSVNATVGNYQPLDTTNTLANIPKALLLSVPYVAGFPVDQPIWESKSTSATYTNLTDTTPFQSLTFPSTSDKLTYRIFPFTYAGQQCSLLFSMKGGTATTITVSLKRLSSNTTALTQTFTNISTTSFINFSIPFNLPDELYIELSGASGYVLARNWAVIFGTSANTQIRGNLSVPYGNITSSDYFFGPSQLSLTTALSNLSNVANTAPSDLPVSTATQSALTLKMSNNNPTFTGNLTGNTNFSVDSNGIIRCNDVKYTNGGTSLATLLSTLATNNYVNNSLANYQPLDTTNTLASLPVNVATSSFYFDGFPNDQPNWAKLNSANFSNNIGSSLYQTLTFPSTSAQLSLIVNTNTYPLQSCTLAFSLQGGTATTITVSIKLSGPGTVLATSTLTNISTTSYTNFSIPFTAPGMIDTFYITLNGATGTFTARNWNVFAGTSINTQIRGNLSIPYGNITTNDVFYGPSTLSLITGFSKLSNVANTGPSDLPVSTATQTALNNKLNIANPTYTGMLSNANSNFQVDNTGNVNCYDVKYNGGISLITSFSRLSNVANTAPSDLPVSTATETALNNQMTILTNITAQRMTSTDPSYNGTLTGNAGFQVDSSNNLRTSGWISCQSFFCTSIKVNNVSIPLFNNGSTSSNNSCIIPLTLTQSSVYNYVEVKIGFVANALASLITFVGNTATDGTGTNISLSETGEKSTASTTQGTPTYTQNGTVAINVPPYGITNQLKISITKGNNALIYGNRNYYTFEASYCQNSVGSVRSVGFGHLDSTSLASIIVKSTGGTMNATWSTVHYY